LIALVGGPHRDRWKTFVREIWNIAGVWTTLEPVWKERPPNQDKFQFGGKG